MAERRGTDPDRLRRLGCFPGRHQGTARSSSPGDRRWLRRYGNQGWLSCRWACSGAIGVSTLLSDPATVEAVDRLQSEHASTVAGDGAELARSLGLVAEPQAVPDEVDVADTLIGIARERGAAVVVVGSHGSRAALAPARKRFAEADRALRPAGAGHPRRQRLVGQAAGDSAPFGAGSCAASAARISGSARS